jgi:hypothetical protein
MHCRGGGDGGGQLQQWTYLYCIEPGVVHWLEIQREVDSHTTRAAPPSPLSCMRVLIRSTGCTMQVAPIPAKPLSVNCLSFELSVMMQQQQTPKNSNENQHANAQRITVGVLSQVVVRLTVVVAVRKERCVGRLSGE